MEGVYRMTTTAVSAASWDFRSEKVKQKKKT